jgi:hypothetical protein
MSLFCLLCIPLLYFLRRTASGREGESIWALPLGAAAVVIQYFFGPLITPGGFGLSRWFSGFVDIAGLPALVPLMVCGALVLLRVFPPRVDYAGFALLWLVPSAAVRSISENSPPTPIPLIIVPLLWSAQAVGIPFFIACMMKKPRWYIMVFSCFGIAALLIAAATSWWAFFIQRTFLGFLLLSASLAPAVIAMMIDMRASRQPIDIQTPNTTELDY